VKKSDVMDDKDRQTITSNLSKLVLRTQWNEKLEKNLCAQGVFKPKMIELIKANGKENEAWVREMYLYVQKRGPLAFKNLVSSLAESGNSVAANILDCSVQVITPPSPLPEDTQNKVWNLPTYTVPMDIEAVHQLPSYCKEAPLVDDRNPIEVKVVPASKYRGPPAMPNCYPMSRKIRGQCLIIDNEKFINDILPFREGSKIDSNNLDILFEQLGFRVTLRRNLNYNDMMRTINNFSDLSDHSNAQMCGK